MTPPTADSPPASGHRLRQWLSRYETPLWVFVMVALVFLRWPVIKGYYYKATDAVAPPTAIRWRVDVDAALGEARRDGRRVVIDFTADWCPPCIVMTHEVWPNPEVARAIDAGFVPVLIDTDRDGATASRYGVEGIPTVVLLNADGTELRRGAPLTAPAMLDFLATAR